MRAYRRSDLRLRLTLCHPSRRDEELDLDFWIFDTSIARRWGELMVFLNQRGAFVYDPERFYNFPGNPNSTDEWIHKEITRCVDGINRVLPDHVTMQLGPTMDQQMLNTLHERFAHGEIDVGDEDAVHAILFSDKPLSEGKHLIKDAAHWQRFRDALRAHAGLDVESHSYREVLAGLEGHPEFGRILQEFFSSMKPAHPFLIDLNKAIHRSENKQVLEQVQASGGEPWYYFVLNYCPGCCIHMQDEDYEHFTIEDAFGRVYLEDMTAGKCIWDVYRDKDDVMLDEHYKSLGYYWGDSRFYFGPTHSPNWTKRRLADFWSWFDANEAALNKRGIARDDPKLVSLGSVPVAELDRKGRLKNLDEKAVVKLISQHQHMKRVRIVSGDGTEVPRSRFSERFASWYDVLVAFGGTGKTAGHYA